MVDYYELLPNIFSLIFVVINIIITILFLRAYIKYKNIDLLLTGIAWMGMAFPSFPEVIALFLILGAPNPGNEIVITLYLITNIAIIPLFIIIWTYVMSRLIRLRNSLRYLILVTTVVISLIFEGYIWFLFYTNRNAVGTFNGPYLIAWRLFIEMFLISLISIVLILGLSLAITSIRAPNKEIKLKGKILFVAFFTFSLGAILDALLYSVLGNIIARSIMVISSIIFYIGFILPNWAKQILLKQY